MGKGKELFENFVKYMGNFESKSVIKTVEEITEEYEDLSESYGSDRLYSILGAVRDLLKKEIGKEIKRPPNLWVIDRLWSSVDGQGLIYDGDRKVILIDEWFKYPTSPWNLEDFVKTLAQLYNNAALNAESVYGVKLELIDPEDMLKEVEELINEEKEELSEEEDYGPNL